jgi:hypothetical protein
MLHLRVYGPSKAMAEVNAVRAEEVLDFLSKSGVAPEDMALARFDEVGMTLSPYMGLNCIIDGLEPTSGANPSTTVAAVVRFRSRTRLTHYQM